MSMIAMELDQVDINEVIVPTLKRCPFCGIRPITYMRANEERSLFQARVFCIKDECQVAIFANAHTPEEARADARARWERRP